MSRLIVSVVSEFSGCNYRNHTNPTKLLNKKFKNISQISINVYRKLQDAMCYNFSNKNVQKCVL